MTSQELKNNTSHRVNNFRYLVQGHTVLKISLLGHDTYAGLLEKATLQFSSWLACRCKAHCVVLAQNSLCKTDHLHARQGGQNQATSFSLTCSKDGAMQKHGMQMAMWMAMRHSLCYKRISSAHEKFPVLHADQFNGRAGKIHESQADQPLR